MEKQEKYMNWTKNKIQAYGIILGIIGALFGISLTLFIQNLLK